MEGRPEPEEAYCSGVGKCSGTEEVEKGKPFIREEKDEKQMFEMDGDHRHVDEKDEDDVFM